MDGRALAGFLDAGALEAMAPSMARGGGCSH